MNQGISAGGAVALSLGGVLLLGAVAAGGFVLYKSLEGKKAPSSTAPATITVPGNLTVPGPPPLPTVGGSSAAPVGAVVITTPGGSSLSASSGQAPAVGGGQTVQLGNGLSQTYATTQENQWRQTDKIYDLQKELGDVWNRIRVVSADLREIDSRPVEAGIIEAVSNQHYDDCRRNSDGWNFIFGDPCAGKRNATSEGYDRVLKDRWAQRLAEIRAPRLADLSALNRRQLDLIGNLDRLGVRTPRNTDGDSHLRAAGENPERASSSSESATNVSAMGGIRRYA